MVDLGYLDTLTPRERQVYSLIVAGKTNSAIAGELSISRETVKTHVSRILGKLGAIDRMEIRQAARGRPLAECVRN